jgi:hypothetical protein
MLAISSASLSVTAVSGLRSGPDQSSISPQSSESPQSEDEKWSLTVTGQCRTHKNRRSEAIAAGSRRVVTVSRPVGGVLCVARRRRGGHPSMRPTWGSRLQGGTGRASVPCSALLRVGFAEPPGSPRALVRSCRTVSPLPVPLRAIGGLFSVALSCGSPRLAASQHPALWSPDLPRFGHCRTAATRPTHRHAHSRACGREIPCMARPPLLVYEHQFASRDRLPPLSGPPSAELADV